MTTQFNWCKNSISIRTGFRKTCAWWPTRKAKTNEICNINEYVYDLVHASHSEVIGVIILFVTDMIYAGNQT